MGRRFFPSADISQMEEKPVLFSVTVNRSRVPSRDQRSHEGAPGRSASFVSALPSLPARYNALLFPYANLRPSGDQVASSAMTPPARRAPPAARERIQIAGLDVTGTKDLSLPGRNAPAHTS